MTFDTSLVFTLSMEGGFVDNPLDRGGRTNRGITQKTYDQWCKDRGVPAGDVKDVPEATVAAIYRTNYWNAAQCDALRDRVAMAHFDAAVNHGTEMAAKLLQRAVGVVDDGLIGPLTLTAARAMTENLCLGLLLMERRAYYERIVANHPEQMAFLKGWTARLRKLSEALWR